MLVKLTSSTSGEVIMFAAHVRGLFEKIGKACTARGVFAKEQLPDAIARLKQVVEEEKLAARAAAAESQTKPENAGKDEEEKKPEVSVSLGQRAVPLIRLMEWTLKEEGFILWEAPADFDAE